MVLEKRKRAWSHCFSQIMCCRFHKARDNSGIVIYVILWVMVILTALALSLGRNIQIELSLTKHTIGSLKAENLAWAGVVFASHLIKKDSTDEESTNLDTLYYCGIPKTQTKSPEETFNSQVLESGSFHIGYKLDSGEDVIGFEDQERFLNINSVVLENRAIFISFMTSKDIDQTTAENIVSTMIDWKDADSVPMEKPSGAEDDYYMSLSKPYHCKNRPFDTKEELLLVKGVTPEIFAKIKDEITVFPKEGNFQVNFDTATKDVLLAMATALTGAATNTDVSDSQSLVDKILEYRQGEDGVLMTKDDREVDLGRLNLNDKEKVLALIMNQFKTRKSNYFNVHVTGQEKTSKVSSRVEAIIERDTQRIVYWHRDN